MLKNAKPMRVAGRRGSAKMARDARSDAMADPDTDITMEQCLAKFYACAATFDPDLTARRLSAHEVTVEIDAVAVLRNWLARYSDALHRRR